MKNYLYVFSLFLLNIISCSSDSGSQQLNQIEIVSSKGKRIFILTINLGITGDKLYTVIPPLPHDFIVWQNKEKTSQIAGFFMFIAKQYFSVNNL
ncbi:hypothetical protein ACN9MN_15345 [Chryseobacterium sp. S-02]|uniref:hypothetical protein n=1 Tax=Chryseobacterium sp. S-02 TaxID=3404064 RepID=UPI003CEE839D